MFMMSPKQRLKQDKVDTRLASLNIQPNEVVVEYEAGPDDKGKYTYFMNWLTNRHEWHGDTGVRGQIFKDDRTCITNMRNKGFTIRELDHRFNTIR
jgi:hypothetical protein